MTIDIHHRISAETPATDAVYDALTTIPGLAGWWTRDTAGDASLAGTIQFRFPQGGFDMRVEELVPNELVRWTVVDGPEEWIGTSVEFALSRSGDHTVVNFAHRGWAEAGEFHAHCSAKWAQFLFSLKALVETGAGNPSPEDPPISDWH